MSVIKRLVNVATFRVRSLFDGGAPHPGEGALDEELRTAAPEPARARPAPDAPEPAPDPAAPPAPAKKERRL